MGGFVFFFLWKQPSLLDLAAVLSAVLSFVNIETRAFLVSFSAPVLEYFWAKGMTAHLRSGLH